MNAASDEISVLQQLKEGSSRLFNDDGSADGLFQLGFIREELTQEYYSVIADAIVQISAGNRDEADKMIRKTVKEKGTIRLIRAVGRAMRRYLNRLSASEIADYAVDHLRHDSDPEMVKFALLMLSGFHVIPEGVKDDIRTLSEYPGFSWYCYRLMCSWLDGNHEIMASAEKASFWAYPAAVFHLDYSYASAAKWALNRALRQCDYAMVMIDHLYQCIDFIAILDDECDDETLLSICLLLDLVDQGYFSDVHEREDAGLIFNTVSDVLRQRELKLPYEIGFLGKAEWLRR